MALSNQPPPTTHDRKNILTKHTPKNAKKTHLFQKKPHMQQQQQQKHTYTYGTVIGHSPHPPTCVWV